MPHITQEKLNELFDKEPINIIAATFKNGKEFRVNIVLEIAKRTNDTEFIKFFNMSKDEQIALTLKDIELQNEADIQFIVDFLKKEKELNPDRYQKIRQELAGKDQITYNDFLEIIINANI